jgi:hypothetical protein
MKFALIIAGCLVFASCASGPIGQSQNNSSVKLFEGTLDILPKVGDTLLADCASLLPDDVSEEQFADLECVQPGAEGFSKSWKYYADRAIAAGFENQAVNLQSGPHSKLCRNNQESLVIISAPQDAFPYFEGPDSREKMRAWFESLPLLIEYDPEGC